MTSWTADHPAVPQAATDDAAATTLPRLRATGHVVAAGLATGVLVQLLFFDMRLGLNVPLTVAALLLAAWRVRRPGARLDALDAWLPAGAIALSMFFALRSDSALLTVNFIGTLGLTVGAIAAVAGVSVTRRSAVAVTSIGLQVLGAAIALAGPASIDAARAVPSADGLRRRLGPIAPVARGLVLAAPLVVIFIVLFSSADAVFARVLEDVLRVDLDIGDLPGRLLLAGTGAYLAIGALAWAAAASPRSTEAAAQHPRPRLGTTEAATVLIVLDLLFGAFVGLQAAYLFGGLDTMAAAGLTYAEYARRGFFELCAAVAIVGCVILSLEALVGHRRRPYVIAAAGLALLTAVVLGSATMRLGLYQQAYGWTELRFWVAAGIAWLAGGLIAAVVAVVTDRSRWLVHALVVWALVIGLGVNVVGPVRFVAEQNVARAVDPALVPPNGQSGLDAVYLTTLDLDAVEPLVAALPRLQALERTAVSELLAGWRTSAEVRGTDAWQEWNLSRARARDLLLREISPE